ncbi:BIR7B-like protein [Mya arenaria]|uniref:BIR7B-like protein n=1 Tax=Mya arenaria TaxID=6604 RepID=A0ABY7EDK8_MYAAR|nr:BIR7B-like protein [Mya arenaria]
MQATEEFHVRNEQTISIASNRGSLQIRSTADQTLPSPVLPSLVSPVNVRSMTGHLDQARQYTGPETDSFIDIYIQPSRAEGIQESQHLNSEFDEIGEHDERSNSINENNTLLNIPTPNRKEILRRELGATAENSTNDLAGGVNNLHITNPDIKRSIEEQRRICTVDMGFSNEMFSFAVNELRQQGYQRPSIEAIVATIETIHNRSQHDTDIRSNGNRKKTSQEPTPLQNRIKNKAYNTYNLRLTSFAKWPEHIAQRPPKLAEAGLYYTEHCKWFPTCPFAREQKGDEFIARVQAPEGQNVEEVGAAAGNSTNDLVGEVYNHHITEEQRKICIEDMGFSSEMLMFASSELKQQELLQENKRMKQMRTCFICQDNQVNALFLPCTHHRFCMDCSDGLRECPVCSKPIRRTIKT